MDRARVTALLLSLFGVGLSACAESYCSNPDHQFEDACQLIDGGTVSAFTVTPARIAINKDANTEVTINAYTSLANMLVTVTQDDLGAKPLSVGSVSKDGVLTVTIHASDLAMQGFAPGPAIVKIANQRQPVRLYVTPSFDSSTFSAIHDVSNDQGNGNGAAPAWVGITADASKKILTLNEYAIATIAKQAVGEYSYDANNKVLAKSSPLLFSAYNSTPYMDMATRGIALSMSDFVIPEYGNATTSLLTKCSLAGTCAGNSAVKYASIASLSASVSGQLYAGLFNNKLIAFTDSELTNGITVDGTAASSTSPVFVVVYNGNGDEHPDVSAWHGDGSVSLVLADATGKSLSYSVDDGPALKRVAGLTNTQPDAVAAGDIDQDGLDDFVIAKGRSLYILTNVGGGRFAASDAIPIPQMGPMGGAVLTPVNAIAIGDLSADAVGAKDLVLGSRTNRIIAVMENSATVR